VVAFVGVLCSAAAAVVGIVSSGASVLLAL
jgi:hypothetical protein